MDSTNDHLKILHESFWGCALIRVVFGNILLVSVNYLSAQCTNLVEYGNAIWARTRVELFLAKMAKGY